MKLIRMMVAAMMIAAGLFVVSTATNPAPANAEVAGCETGDATKRASVWYKTVAYQDPLYPTIGLRTLKVYLSGATFYIRCELPSGALKFKPKGVEFCIKAHEDNGDHAPLSGLQSMDFNPKYLDSTNEKIVDPGWTAVEPDGLRKVCKTYDINNELWFFNWADPVWELEAKARLTGVQDRIYAFLYNRWYGRPYLNDDPKVDFSGFRVNPDEFRTRPVWPKGV